MAIRRYAAINIATASLSAHPVHFICDTTAELPTSGLKLGDTALALDTNTQYKAASATTWVTVITAGGAVPFTKTAAFSDVTAVVPVTIPAWIAPFPCTVTSIKGCRIGGTGATVQAYRNTTGTPLRSAALSLTSASTWMDGGAVQNTAFNGTTDSLLIAVLTAVGSPTQVSVQVNFTRP